MTQIRNPHARFMRSISVGYPTGCWQWEASTRNGYGRFSVRCVTHLAHRWIYEQTVGPIAEGLHVDHLCRNKLCVNPKHLEPVTPGENTRRHHSIVTHCPHGHEYTEANTQWRTNRRGHRMRGCRTCHRDRERARRRAISCR